MTPLPHALPTIEVDDLDLQLDLGYEETPISIPPPSRPELTRILRWGGGGVLIAAAVSFMFQGVYSFAPMTRHWIMLGVCALLGILGMITGSILKEDKGARAFLSFAAATFPVLASQLGAMFFSLFNRSPQVMPQPLVFSLSTTTKVMAISALTLAIVIPLSHLAFRILARSQAGLLTGVFALANLCILLPVREGAWVGAIITSVGCVVYFTDRLRLSQDFRLDTFEGRGARLLLICPLAVMIGRTFFYDMSSGFYGLLLALTGAYLTFNWGKTAKRGTFRMLCQLTGMAGMTAGWLIYILPALGPVSMNEGFAVYLILLPPAMILAVQSMVTNDQQAINYGNAAAIVGLLSVLFAHWSAAAAPMVSAVGVIIAVAIVSAGTLIGETPIFIFGSLAAAISLGNVCFQAIRLHSGYAWLLLACIGIGIMFVASLIEKKRSFLKNSSLWGRFRVRQ
jgi:hypothetical protein